MKVVIAHCAGLGDNEDLDDLQRKRLPNFDLFLQLMDEQRYEGLLFADISAMTQFNRTGKPLTTILQREDLHERLPLPKRSRVQPAGNQPSRLSNLCRSWNMNVSKV